ncbi:2-ketogluconate transporter [Virgibacillus phasianinus]|uniref:2-ketogluconate transporter n=1 Tax=Virgibacillus phasianinus TaxID=2017483 RepID=A0A220U7I9_9BACI|nr:MFS transporter [Virgibacillus phasianinus]ASK63856.1 2-ketogluconate transporter [Virgibacillus phasianinus]
MEESLSRKRWYRLIPIAFITYSLAYLDRANFSFGSASEMAHDLQITPAISSLLGALFFLGYFFFQVPGAAYAEKKSAKKLIFWSLILWGVLASATGMLSNVYLLIADRFLLGVVESAVMPAMLVFLSHWFTKRERSKANTFLILGNPATVLWMSIVSGYLLEGVGWRWMFIIEGIPPIIWAFIWWKLVNDRPKDAKWLNNTEKGDLEEVLRQEQAAIKPVKNYRSAFKNKKVILLSIQYFLWSLGVYGFMMWLPSILSQAPNMSMIQAGWLSSAPYLLAIIGMLIASYFSDKLLNRRDFVWPFLLVGAVAFYGSYLIGTEQYWLSYTLLVIAGGMMYAPYGPFFAIIPEILPQNVAGGAMALVNSFGALGSFVGAYIVGFLNDVTGSFGASYILMSISLLIAAVITIYVGNEKRTAVSMNSQFSNQGVK